MLSVRSNKTYLTKFSSSQFLSYRDIRTFFNPTLGNCYTFNSGWNLNASLVTSTRIGRRFGRFCIVIFCWIRGEYGYPGRGWLNRYISILTFNVNGNQPIHIICLFTTIRRSKIEHIVLTAVKFERTMHGSESI